MDSERPLTTLRPQFGGYARYVLALMVAINFISHLFGDSHAPADVGWLSDRLQSLQLALLLTSAPLLLLAAAAAASGLRSADRDAAIMERSWAAKRSEVEPAVVPLP